MSTDEELVGWAKFHAFHQANPKVYDHLVRLAWKWVSAGRQKLGVSMLYEVLRWEIALETTEEVYKLNDHFQPYYARYIMANEPGLEGLFELRQSFADEAGMFEVAA